MGVSVKEGVAVTLAVGVGLAVGVALGVELGVRVDDGVSVTVGVAVFVGVRVSVGVRVMVNVAVGCVFVGVAVGCVAVGVAVGCVGVMVGVGVHVDTRTMICAVGPGTPFLSVTCAVTSVSPCGKAWSAVMLSQNCAVAPVMYAWSPPPFTKVHAELGDWYEKKVAKLCSVLMIDGVGAKLAGSTPGMLPCTL